MSGRKPEWTRSQLAALRRRGNTVVSAAAGSGKTTVMTEKIASLLRNGAKLTEMLVVTFTRDAAAQLREKIGKNLAGEAKNGDRSAEAHLAALPLAEIGTIHTFCGRVIRENFGLLRIPANFSIAEEKVSDVLMKKAVAETMDDLFDAPSGDGDEEDIAFVCDVIGESRNPDAAANTLIEIYKVLRRSGYDGTKLLRDADRLEKYAGTDYLSTPWGEAVAEATEEMADHYRAVFDELAGGLRETEKPWREYGPTAVALRDYFSHVSDVLKERDYDRVREAMSLIPNPELGSLRKAEKTDDAVLVPSMRDESQKTAKKYLEKYFSASPEEISDAMRRTARVLRGVSRAVSAFEEKYESLKRRRGMLDFQDLETMAYRLLVNEDGGPTEAALRIGKKYKYIFVDEYQDTNRVQDAIFRAVGTNAERFMVGDVKQSVYRFRGAEPGIFSDYRERWDPFGPEDDDDGQPRDACVFMSDNFRCSRPIVKFVNRVSEYMFRGGDVAFGVEDLLDPSTNSEVDAPVEIRLLEPGKKGPAEADYVAKRIKEMIGTSPFGKVPLKPSDFAIILRSTKTKAEAFAKALTKIGVPVSDPGGARVSGEPDFQFAVDLLRAVDNPHRDVSVANVMMSSLFGFTLDEMTTIRLRYGTGSLFSSVLRMREDGEDGLPLKCAAFCDRIKYFRETERSLGASVFIERLFEETGIARAPEILSVQNGGEHVRDLLDLARVYERSSWGGLYGFLRYLDDLELSGGPRTTLGGSEGVTITTIHKSKGLEYPVCFFCGTGADMDGHRDGSTVFGRELGWAMRLPDPGGLVRCRTPLMDAIEAKDDVGVRYEELRLIYVAMTRAVHKLVVVAKPSRRSSSTVLEAADASSRFRDRYTVLNLPAEIDYILAAGANHAEKVFDLDTVGLTEEDDCVPETAAAATSGEETAVDPEKFGAAVDFMEKRFSAEYPHSYLDGIPSKLSVSRLYPDVLTPEDGVTDLEKEREDELDRRMALPSFMTGSLPVTGRERGIATHSFMQFADLERLATGTVEDEIDRLVRDDFLSARDGEIINVRQVERFVKSPLFGRIAGARRVWREFRFNVLLPAEKFTSDPDRASKFREKNVKITVQGVFDCVFEDADGKLAVADYKTDYMSDADRRDPAKWIAELKERHALQLRYYREAAALLFGRDPDEVLIYALALGDTVDMKNA